jgi:hypothetical protein
MNIHHLKFLKKIIRKKNGTALDIASGNNKYTNYLRENKWYVHSLDINKKSNYHESKIKHIKINLEKTSSHKLIKTLKFSKYDLIILFKFMHRPLFRTIPILMKRGGIFFCETFMIIDGVGKLRTKEYMLKKNELLNLRNKKMKLELFYQGKDKKENFIQSAIFKKL